MTAKAANVLFGYWSHDIGGFFLPDPSAELFARWCQAGVFLPILRIHGITGSERRVWAPQYAAAYPVMRAALILRTLLAPHRYTLWREAYDTGLAAVRPMYYFPELQQDAFTYDLQFLWGDTIVARPVTEPVDPATGAAQIKVWLPATASGGGWIDGHTNEACSAGSESTLSTPLDRMLWFVRSGTLVPMLPLGTMDAQALRTTNADAVWALFCQGPCNTTGRVYLDDGVSTAYQQGNFSWLNATAGFSPAAAYLHVDQPANAAPRGHRLLFRTPSKLAVASAACNGQALAPNPQRDQPGWRYTDASDIPLAPPGSLYLTCPAAGRLELAIAFK